MLHEKWFPPASYREATMWIVMQSTLTGLANDVIIWAARCSVNYA